MTSYVGIWCDINLKVYAEYILVNIMPPLIFILGVIFPMFEYASIHNTCELHVMLDSKVIKTQFRLDSVYTCHMMLYTCHSLVYPVIHQLYSKWFFPYFWGSFWCLNLHGCTSHTHSMIYWSRNLINHTHRERERVQTVTSKNGYMQV